MLDIAYSNQAKKLIKKADKILAKRLLDEIESLTEKPFTKDTKPVEGYKEKVFRVRVGDYRILYEVDYQNNKLGIIKIDNRSKVY